MIQTEAEYVPYLPHDFYISLAETVRVREEPRAGKIEEVHVATVTLMNAHLNYASTT